MKKKLCVVALFSLFGFLSCNNDTPEQNPVQTGDPVETNPPNTDYEPAFPGQTRIGSVKTETNIKVQEIASVLVVRGRLSVCQTTTFLLPIKPVLCKSLRLKGI